MTIDRVAVIPFPGIDGAFLCISGKKRSQTMVGDRWYGKPEHTEIISRYADRDFATEPCVTFLFNVGTVAAEWDGAYGPIQITYQVPEGFTMPADSWGGEPHQHWFFPWAIWRGHWSQMAVTENRLPQMFNVGDYAGIFAVLRAWADRPNEYWNGEIDAALAKAGA